MGHGPEIHLLQEKIGSLACLLQNTRPKSTMSHRDGILNSSFLDKDNESMYTMRYDMHHTCC